MNLQTNDLFKSQTQGRRDFRQNVIRKTRQIISDMNQVQRFRKARAHILDALNYKHPRYQSQSLKMSLLFKILYQIWSHSIWSWILFLGGYAYLFLVILDSDQFAVKLGTEASLLILFWSDTCIYIYLKKFDKFKQKYSKFFHFKWIIILLMTIDLIIFIALPCYNSRPIRPFRILRCFVPCLYDSQMRKTLLSLLSAYKDVLVYLIFFSTIIVGYALVGNRALTYDANYKDPNFPQNVDPYKTNYSDLPTMIFMVYVTATYDSYPDNQYLVIQNYEPNYLYYIIFIFANMFLFSSIPGSIIYIGFRNKRSQILLKDQIRQQHSLMIAFVTLADEESSLSIDKLIKFLLFLYRYKIRYVEYITDICLKLDNNNTRSIKVNQFMQLSKILLQNEVMLPPSFDDLELWINFRAYVNNKLKLKLIVRHWAFQLVVSIIIILSFINAIFFMFSYTTLIETFDIIFVWVFFAELMIRIIAIGPENFFLDRWNNTQTILVAVGIIFFFMPNNNNADGVVRMSRIFRLASLLRLVSHSNFMKNIQFQIPRKLKNMYSILLQILPIILRFMPLFLFFFYIFSIVGMEFFYNFYETRGISNYNQYQQFGNFQTFIHAQYVMVQILTEAGWSQVAYDHSWRAPQYFVYILLFFCLQHIMIVYVIATLIKGIFWQVFFTVNSIYEKRDLQNELQEIKQEQFAAKSKQIKQISQKIDHKKWILPNTILKKELIQNKFDQQIFQKLNQIYQNQAHSPLRSKKYLTQRIIKNWQININELQVSQDAKMKYNNSQRSHNKSSRSIRSLSNRSEDSKLRLHQIQQMDEEDIQSQLSQILDKLLVNPKIKYNQIIASPKVFVDFLKSKLKHPEQLIKDSSFNMNENPFHNKESMYTFIYQIHELLDIQTSKREQKALIINSLVEQNVITEEIAEKLIHKKLQQKSFNVDTNGVIRQLFMSQFNEVLIKNFETQYFSEIYGHSYKQINKIMLEPLLRLEATLTYSLRSILRYPQIINTQFFEMLTSIQNKISNKLLQKGSLFKFIYKLDQEGDIWFSIEYKKQQQMKVHFIKSGIWCYYKEMATSQVYYGRDMFNWKFSQGSDAKMCKEYIKRFYQNFETLAFSLLDDSNFFTSNPKYHIYDLYIEHFDVEKTSRYIRRKLQISGIMAVILSKEQEREDMNMPELPYSLSDLQIDHKVKKQINSKLDRLENQSFEKLKNIGAEDSEKIVQSEGLPFAFIIDLLHQISDTVKTYAPNFVYQIEKVLNEQYEEMKDYARQKLNSSRKQDNVIETEMHL